MGMVEPKFFVVGSVRTGSTLLRLMIGHHPDVCECEEMEYLLPGIEIEQSGSSLKKYKEFLKYDRIFKHYQYSIPECTSNYRDLAESIFGQLIERNQGATVAGGTVHNNFSLLADMWPNAKFIFLDRDPRDVARSVMAMGWSGTGWNAAEYWIKARANWDIVQQKVNAENLLEISFVDLINYPEENLEKVCQLLGITYDESMLQIDSDTSYKSPDKKEAASWQIKSEERDVVEIEARIGLERLKSIGYELSSYPPFVPSMLNLLKIKIRDKWVCTRFKVRRYGLKLWLNDLTLRRIAPIFWQARILPRLNDIDENFLK